MKTEIQQAASLERLGALICLIRGHKVMLSGDLASLYEVEPKVLVQAVKRNRMSFPSDFMFQLTAAEFSILKSQSVTSSWGGIRRATPYAFTEQGVAMLSSVLRSQRAVQVNIAIMRAFVRMRQVLETHKDLAARLERLERHLLDNDSTLANHADQIKTVFEALRQLMQPPEHPKRRIGFVQNEG